MTIVKKIGNVTFKLKIKFSMTNSCFLCGGFYCYNSETTQFNDMPDNDEKANTLLMIKKQLMQVY